LFSHTHWDHIQGFPFFVPIFIPTTSLKMYAPKAIQDVDSLENVMKRQMSYQVFPISLEAINTMNSKIEYNDIVEGKIDLPELEKEGVTITAQYMNHPVVCLGYKITYKDKTIIYTGDNEPYYNVFASNNQPQKNEEAQQKKKSVLFDDDEEDNIDDKEAEKATQEMNQKFLDFIKDCDILISDSQYTEAEYQTKRGWGHTSFETNISRALAANVKKLYCFHHEPMRSDAQLDELLEKFRQQLANEGKSLEIYMSYEGLELTI
ncbi:MAG TPA: MBL fold metallo-hydrolase, partial [bacterium]|nr:MBL fold metallo-hydrolase [bacterium]